MSFEAINRLSCENYPKKDSKLIKYGTAGFRTNADELDFVMFRMGLLACLRSCEKKAAIGIMITASHNPADENGIKLIDPMGEMLAMNWESHATMLANAHNSDVVRVLQAIVKEHGIDLVKPIIFVGRDTRPSSLRLYEAVVSGAKTLKAEVRDFEIVSTPVIHFAIACYNGNEKFGKPTEASYLDKLSQAFCNLYNLNKSSARSHIPTILFDGANGVGAVMMAKVKRLLDDKLDVKMFNSNGILNHLCGADHVKSTQSWPKGVPEERNIRCASVDGDADRLVYSYLDDDGKFVLLDGDKLAILITGYLKKLLSSSGISLNLGLVQTAYANGASTNYIEKVLGVPVSCAKTGVKYLHEEALQYDIGVYFEANGHGTIIFSESARDIITEKAKDEKNLSAFELLCAMNVINETVGDAISDMLLVESVLHAYDWSEKQWSESYSDLPNKLMKVTVSDRSAIETTNAERTCTKPVGLQEKINTLVAQYDQGRAFVRPSGTEDIVRIYAEAATRDSTDKLASEIACAVHTMAGGIGNLPH